jgi:DNA-binding CsgD family transcriptional regulator
VFRDLGGCLRRRHGEGPLPRAAPTSSAPLPREAAKAGSFNIAYQVLGEGPIDFVLSPGWVTHLDLTWSVPPLARFLFWAPSLDDEETKAAYLRLTRSAVSPGSARSLMKLGYQIDWEAVLPRIHVPTLILHRTGDLVVPIRQARQLAEGILGARFVELPGIDHLMWAGDHDAIVDAARSFLEDAGVSSGSETALPGLVSGRELGLTRREREVLRLVARGLTNRQIAATLFISTKTAGVHVSNILTKMGVERRAEAAAVAERLHLLTPPPEEPHPAPARPT